MAAIEPLAIVRLDVSDASGGLALSTEAGWNQTEADWRFFLQYAITFGVRAEGRLIATAALLPHDASEAWIGMVLVTAHWRRRRLATRLLAQCLAVAADNQLTVSLDATPAGAVVYNRIGFQPTLELVRLRFEGPEPSRDIATLEPSVSSNRLNVLIARDRDAIGYDRSKLLHALGRRAGSRLVTAGDDAVLVREGRTARHVGPLFAGGAGRALALVGGIAAEDGGRLLIDAVAVHRDFVAGLIAAGWSIERPFERMRFGAAGPASGAPPFAIAGPEYG